MTISYSDRVENTVEKRENVVYQHFPLFPQCFPSVFFCKIVKKSGLCGKELSHILGLDKLILNFQYIKSGLFSQVLDKPLFAYISESHNKSLH